MKRLFILNSNKAHEDTHIFSGRLKESTCSNELLIQCDLVVTIINQESGHILTWQVFLVSQLQYDYFHNTSHKQLNKATSPNR